MSENYKALTRKYRPKSFEDIVSQGHVSNTIQNAIRDGRLSHAYLFCGPRGVGKTTMARVLARTINGIGDDVDGEAITQNMNIMEIDAASNNSVDDIRMLRDTVIIPPSEGRYKIYIIDEVHMLSKQAFNALLKTLEEPPSYVVFIFATTEPHKILPTILSRCQRFDFRRISVDEIIGRLRKICEIEEIVIDNESLHHIARKADGALRDALGLLDQVIAFCGTTITSEAMMRALNIVSTERLFETVDYIFKNDTSAGLQLIDTLLAEGYDIQEFLVELLTHLRNLFVARDIRQLSLIEATDETRARYKEQAILFSADDIMRMLHITLTAQTLVKEAQQPRIQIEIAILKLISMERSSNLQALMNEIRELKELMAAGGVVPETRSAHLEKRTPDNQGSRTDNSTQNRTQPTQTPPSKTPAPQSQSVSSRPSPTVKPAQSTSAESDELFGSPAIKKSQSGPDISGNFESSDAQMHDVSASQPAGNLRMDSGSIQILDGNLALSSKIESTPQSKRVILEDIRSQWAQFIEFSRDQIPQILFFAIGRAEASDLQHGEVTIHCGDAFSYKLLEEHRKTLSGLLSSYHESALAAKILLKTDEVASTSDDPYTRFKTMAQNNPKIRLMVDLFGAELEY